MAEELAAKLARRAQINEGEAVEASPERKIFNPYTEFPVRGREGSFSCGRRAECLLLDGRSRFSPYLITHAFAGV